MFSNSFEYISFPKRLGCSVPATQSLRFPPALSLGKVARELAPLHYANTLAFLLVIHFGKEKKKSQFSCTATKKDKAGASVLPKDPPVYFELF
jgi:hypothetical protein